MIAILLLAIPCFLYGMGIFPTASIITLAAISWMVIIIRIIGCLALMGAGTSAKPAKPEIFPYVWTMHAVSIFAMVCLFMAGYTITFGFMLVTSIVTFLIFLNTVFGQKQIED